MKFAIAVHGSAFASDSPRQAQRFVRACVARGHTVERVFFFHDGVLNGLSTPVPPQDEPDPLSEWITLANEHAIELAVCIASGTKRGVLDNAAQDRHERSAVTLAEPFQLVGLGQLIAAIDSADRYVEFPG